MANYNIDEPDERGYWYDVKITKKVKPKKPKLESKSCHFVKSHFKPKIKSGMMQAFSSLKS